MHCSTSGKRAFIRKLIGAQESTAIVRKPEVNQDVLLQLIGQQQPKKQLVQVDISAGLRKAGILQAFPTEVWPPTAPVGEVATWIANRKKGGNANYAYVFVNLKKYAIEFSLCSFSLLHSCMQGFFRASALTL